MLPADMHLSASLLILFFSPLGPYRGFSVTEGCVSLCSCVAHPRILIFPIPLLSSCLARSRSLLNSLFAFI
ncbi:hypothetical protein F4821DRAFT_225374, partial [Hypoxylon rubiginosum]